MFDTLKYLKTLEESDFTHIQAEGQTKALLEVLEGNISELTTEQVLNLIKPNLQELQEIKDKLALLEMNTVVLKNNITNINYCLGFLGVSILLSIFTALIVLIVR